MVEEYRDESGNIRMLARSEPNEDHRKMRAGMLSFTDWLRANGGDLIPRNKLVDVSRRETLGTKFINDQQSTSGCSCWSGVQLLRRTLALRGHQDKDLSGAFVYAHLNGGNANNGTVITDVQTHLQNIGTVERSEMDIPHMYPRDITAALTKSAGRNRLGLCVRARYFDEWLTAVSMGFVGELPIRVSGGRFEQFTNDGVAGFTRGPGDHAIGVDGCKLINGKWVLDLFNSWRDTWGPFKNGRCFITEEMVEGAGYPDDGYIGIDALFDPLDPNIPPSPVT